MRKPVISLVMVLILAIALPAFAQSDKRGVQVKGKESRSAPIATRYYALIIGNNDYRDLVKLKTAVADATAIEELLKTRYGFETQLLLNATRRQIMDSINEFRKRLTRNDHFLIYYAGHGEFDGTVDKAYWLPVNAKKDSDSNWIIADDITSNIKRITARHILIVSDSCYSGTLTRAAVTQTKGGSERDEYLKKMRERPSRTLMASGGAEPVADSGGGNHSVFGAAFIKALREADKPVFTAEEIFHARVKGLVAGKSDQVPEYNSIRNSGDEGGDFVFQLADASGGPQDAISVPPAAAGDEPPDSALKAAENEARRRAELEREKAKKGTALATVTRPSATGRNEIRKDGRFIAYDNGTVLDTWTNLMWAAKDNGHDLNWQYAKKYCENYRGGGYTDWRMPTHDELAGLYGSGKGYRTPCGYDVQLTELIGLTCNWVWAAEMRGSDAASFVFNGGFRNWSFQSYMLYLRALPVRSGK